MREKIHAFSENSRSFHSTVFRKTLLSLLSFFLTCILLLFVVLSYTSSHSLRENYIKSNQLFLQQTQRTVELTIDNLMTNMTTLLYSRDIIRGTVANSLLNYETTNSLLSLLASTCASISLVDYIGYYVIGSDTAYDSEKIISTLNTTSHADILARYLSGEASITKIRREDFVCDIIAADGCLYSVGTCDLFEEEASGNNRHSSWTYGFQSQQCTNKKVFSEGK